MAAKTPRRIVTEYISLIRRTTNAIRKEWDVPVGFYKTRGYELPGEHPADWVRLCNQIMTAQAYLAGLLALAEREAARQRVIHAGGDDPMGGDA